MGRQAPVVTTGMKEGRAARDGIAQAKREVGAGIYARISALLRGKTPEAPKPATPYEVVFQSKYRGHRIQIDSPADIIDNRGRKTMGRTLFAQFRDGHFSVPKWVKAPDAQFMLDILRGHPAYNRDFWEEKDNSHEIRVAQVARVVDLLEKDQDIKNTVLDYLTERDFVQPQVDGVGAASTEELDEIHAADAAPKVKPRKPALKPTAKGRRAQSSI